MVDRAALEEWSEDEVLDFAGGCAETVRRAEVDLLRAACQWAVLHAPQRLDPARSELPGRERARQLGGPGTPRVTEFAAAVFGARIGRSSWAARQLIADALDLCHRHPRLWERVQAGEVRSSYARHVVGRTRDLEPEQAAFVDAGVAEPADGRISWSRFEALVAGKVAQAAPEVAREKEERARQATFAKKLRGEAHGMGSYLVRADAATVAAIAAGFATQAARIGARWPQDPDLATEDQRLVRAVLMAATGATIAATVPEAQPDTDPDADPEEPGVPEVADVSGLLPQVVVYVHGYGGPDREDVVRVEGHGPVTEGWVREVLGPRARFVVQPVLDLAGQAPVDAYEIPQRHREAVHLMTPADTFPYASCTSRDMQVDHTIAYVEGETGQSRVGNYGPMTVPHHRVKTHGGWQVKQPFPGIYVWRDPYGGFYLVDHTGTRRLPTEPPEAPGPTPPRRLVVELWHTSPGIDIAYEPAA